MFHRMSVKAICIFPMHENLFITSVQAITIQVFTSKSKKKKKKKKKKENKKETKQNKQFKY